MASINFRTKGKDKPESTIYVTFRNGRNCALEVSSKIVAPNSNWIARGKVVNKEGHEKYIRTNLQAKLDALRAKISSDLVANKQYTKEWLQLVVDDFHGITPEQDDKLTDYFDKYIEHKKFEVGDDLSPHTLKTYVTSKNRIKEFEKYQIEKKKRTKEYSLNEVGLEFKSDFIRWAKHEVKYSPASFMKTLKQIKPVLKYARDLQIQIDEAYLKDTKSLSQSKNSKDKQRLPPLYLNLSEINSLRKFKGSDYLENARDWLVISCWTACRVGDLMNLNSSNIEITISGEKSIRYQQNKVGIEVVTPYHDHVAEIIERNGGEFPRPISDVKYNLYIKELCKRVGMTQIIKGEKTIVLEDGVSKRKVRGLFPKHELIASHVGRRSFASNHYGLLPTEVIMLVTGHESIKQFLEYVGKKSDEHIDIMHKFYQDQKEKQASKATIQ